MMWRNVWESIKERKSDHGVRKRADSLVECDRKRLEVRNKGKEGVRKEIAECTA